MYCSISNGSIKSIWLSLTQFINVEIRSLWSVRKKIKIVKKLFRKHKDLYSILYKSLENRRQHIKIGNNYSEWDRLLNQRGSTGLNTIGPVLFVIAWILIVLSVFVFLFFFSIVIVNNLIKRNYLITFFYYRLITKRN